MADLDKMDRTWLCSVLFMDIVNYSSQSVELQMRWKKRFNGYLTEAIQEVPEGDRVILDTGDGAAICFLGAPEVAMFTGLQLCRSFSLDAREQQPGLRVRLGINLGPVKLVKDINGALNALGDGMNAGQRIMSFASENQILVSQSYFEVVSRLSDDYKQMFQLKGVETDKHVREHTVYHLTPPGSEKREQLVANADGQTVATPKAAPIIVASPETRGPRAQWLPLVDCGRGTGGCRSGRRGTLPGISGSGPGGPSTPRTGGRNRQPGRPAIHVAGPPLRHIRGRDDDGCPSGASRRRHGRKYSGARSIQTRSEGSSRAIQRNCRCAFARSKGSL